MRYLLNTIAVLAGALALSGLLGFADSAVDPSPELTGAAFALTRLTAGLAILAVCVGFDLTLNALARIEARLSQVTERAAPSDAADE